MLSGKCHLPTQKRGASSRCPGPSREATNYALIPLVLLMIAPRISLARGGGEVSLSGLSELGIEISLSSQLDIDHEEIKTELMSTVEQILRSSGIRVRDDAPSKLAYRIGLRQCGCQRSKETALWAEAAVFEPVTIHRGTESVGGFMATWTRSRQFSGGVKVNDHAVKFYVTQWTLDVVSATGRYAFSQDTEPERRK